MTKPTKKEWDDPDVTARLIEMMISETAAWRDKNGVVLPHWGPEKLSHNLAAALDYAGERVDGYALGHFLEIHCHWPTDQELVSALAKTRNHRDAILVEFNGSAFNDKAIRKFIKFPIGTSFELKYPDVGKEGWRYYITEDHDNLYNIIHRESGTLHKAVLHEILQEYGYNFQLPEDFIPTSGYLGPQFGVE